MSIYLISIYLMLPGQAAPAQELQRHLLTASSASVCQFHADKMAEQQRAANYATVDRLRATVVGVCVQKGTTT